MSAPRIVLRDYQIEAIGEVRDHYRRGNRAALLVLCTGAGKTLTALTMSAKVIEKGGRVLWLAHRSELVEQPVRTWNSLGQLRDAGPAGIVQASRDDVGASLICASVGTVGRDVESETGRLSRIIEGSQHPLRLVVLDEAHHYADDARGMFASILPAIDKHAARLGQPAPFQLGLTATPERMDGRGLVGLWGNAPVYQYGFSRAIQEGYLCPPRVVLERLELDEETAATVAKARDVDGGVDRETARALLDSGLVEWTVEKMGRHLRGRSVLAFTCDLNQARLLAGQLRDQGWKSAVVSGDTPRGQRRALLRAFEAGEVDVLVNCNVLTEGTDLPRCDALVLARPFASKVLYVQAMGRGLRLYPGKSECVVLDVLGATEEHSLIHAAGLLEGRQVKPEPFRGITRRTVSTDFARVAAQTAVGCVPWEDAPEGDERDYLVVSIIAGMNETPLRSPIPVQRGRDVVADGEGKVPLPDLLRQRQRVEAHWVPVPGAGGAALVADLADQGRVWLVDIGDGWMSYHVPKKARKPRPLERSPMDAGYARGLADDLFRQAQGLVRRNARWRDRPPSEGQRRYAERLGLRVVGDSAGAFSDAIAGKKGAEFWAKHGPEAFTKALAGAR